MATFIVDSGDDSGIGTLRQAIIAANGDPGADTIKILASVTTLTLASALPTITGELTFDDGFNLSELLKATAYPVLDIAAGGRAMLESSGAFRLDTTGAGAVTVSGHFNLAGDLNHTGGTTADGATLAVGTSRTVRSRAT